MAGCGCDGVIFACVVGLIVNGREEVETDGRRGERERGGGRREGVDAREGLHRRRGRRRNASERGGSVVKTRIESGLLSEGCERVLRKNL